MPRLAQAEARVPFQVADSFVLASDDFMTRTRQGGHVSQSVLEVAGPPRPDRPRPALRRLPGKRSLWVPAPRCCGWTLLPYRSVPLPPEGSLSLISGESAP